MAHDILAGRERRGERELIRLVGDEGVGGPRAVGVLAVVCDLEPDGVSAGLVGGAGAGAFGQIGGNGAAVLSSGQKGFGREGKTFGRGALRSRAR